jgi:hypothetical protein
VNLAIENRIEACRDGVRHERDPEAIVGVSIHRIDLSKFGAEDAASIAKAFREIPELRKVTGGEMPYSVFALKDGRLQQALEVGDAGPHARKWSTPMVAFAALGDFTREGYRLGQWTGLARLTALFCVRQGWRASDVWRTIEGRHVRRVCGHDELPGGSSDLKKECPGKLWPMAKFRELVNAYIDEARTVLNPKGELDEQAVQFAAEKALLEARLVF